VWRGGTPSSWLPHLVSSRRNWLGGHENRVERARLQSRFAAQFITIAPSGRAFGEPFKHATCLGRYSRNLSPKQSTYIILSVNSYNNSERLIQMIAAKVASNCCVQLRAEAHWDQFKLVVGRARSLMVATTVGFVGVAGLIIISVWMQSVWICIVSVLMLMNSGGGLRQHGYCRVWQNRSVYDALACPSCNAAPPAGAYWICRQLGSHSTRSKRKAVCPY